VDQCPLVIGEEINQALLGEVTLKEASQVAHR